MVQKQFLSSLAVVMTMLPCFTLSAQTPDTLPLLYQWKDDSLQGSSRYDNTYNEVWGFVQNNKEYAVIGSTAGTHILPLDDLQSNPKPYFVPGSSRGSHVIHRDYHDYEGYLYAVCDEGSSSTLQIIDLRNIEDSLEIVYDSNEFFSRAHNIFIDSAKARLYVCSQKGTSYYPLGLYDISDPASPSLINIYSDFGGGGISHVHDAYVVNDTAFLNCGPSGLRIVDFTDPFSPRLLASLTDYPFRGYNHSGWATPDLKYYYMGDETHGAEMKVIRIDDIQEPEVVNTFNAGNPHEFSIPHNQVVHCDKLYVSYYFDGLHVYDIKDPESPQRQYVYQSSSEEHIDNYKGAWGVYPFFTSNRILVSDMQEGLFVLQGPECGTVSSTEQPADHSFSMYPNPSNGILNISLASYTEKATVRIFNVKGQLMFESTDSTQRQFRLPSNLQEGVYLIQVQTGHQTHHQLLILSP